MTDPSAQPAIDMLGGLLGPTGPELTCEACFEHLNSYVELELSNRDADATIPGMRAHLTGCPACAEDHDSLHAFVESEQYGSR